MIEFFELSCNINKKATSIQHIVRSILLVMTAMEKKDEAEY